MMILTAGVITAVISINVYERCSTATGSHGRIHQSIRRNKLKSTRDFPLHSLNRVLTPARYRGRCNWHIIKVPRLIIIYG